MKCSKCKKEILTKVARLKKQVLCQRCWWKSKSKGGNTYSYWNKYVRT